MLIRSLTLQHKKHQQIIHKYLKCLTTSTCKHNCYKLFLYNSRAISLLFLTNTTKNNEREKQLKHWQKSTHLVHAIVAYLRQSDLITVVLYWPLSVSINVPVVRWGWLPISLTRQGHLLAGSKGDHFGQRCEQEGDSCKHWLDTQNTIFAHFTPLQFLANLAPNISHTNSRDRYQASRVTSQKIKRATRAIYSKKSRIFKASALLTKLMEADLRETFYLKIAATKIQQWKTYAFDNI